MINKGFTFLSRFFSKNFKDDLDYKLTLRNLQDSLQRRGRIIAVYVYKCLACKWFSFFSSLLHWKKN